MRFLPSLSFSFTPILITFPIISRYNRPRSRFTYAISARVNFISIVFDPLSRVKLVYLSHHFMHFTKYLNME